MHSQQFNRRDRQRATPGVTPTWSIRVRRGRSLWPSLLLLLVAASEGPSPPGPIAVTLLANRDTLIYGFSWTAGAGATSYDVTYSVAATNGTWSLAADSNGSGKFVPVAPRGPLPYAWTTCCTAQKAWFTAIPWDSATFTVSVASRNAVGVSAIVSTTWVVRRLPGPPGPPVVDSIGFLLSEGETLVSMVIRNKLLRRWGVAPHDSVLYQVCAFGITSTGRKLVVSGWGKPLCTDTLFRYWLAEVPT